MESPSAPLEPQATLTRSFLSPWSALMLATWFGLVGGYLDLGMIFLKRDLFHESLYYEQGRHFRWGVPVANLVAMMVPGLLFAGINRLRKGFISLRAAAWAFATLALWGPLLRAPIHGFASLILAFGVARWTSRQIADRADGFWLMARATLAMLAIAVSATAVLTYRRQIHEETAARQRLPAPPVGAGNVLLIVMDTVRADSLGLHGYDRDTTPNLSRWAKRGVRFEWAQAAAPWTFPSHCSFMTGQWPSTLNAHWLPTLDRGYSTLAEFLASRGYLTAGFVANTHWCSYESGMDRGFVHYEDYPLAPRTILGSTRPGRWILETLLYPDDGYNAKWVRSQSRDARGINQAFLSWLDRERPSRRPFFAFLNYLDAHEPFLPPNNETIHFGLRPETASERKMLLEYWDRDKLKLSERDVVLARDSYDTCIAALDRQIGALLDELDRRGVLEQTVVIITSDHGEQFGEHGVFNHGFSLYTHETHVPLVVISPSVPAGRGISQPVSLRDLPATVVDLLGLRDGSPFPGHSLSAHWRATTGGEARGGSPALSEVDIPYEITPHRGRGPNQRGFTMSLVDRGLHYLVDIRGKEELYDVSGDPGETRDLKEGADQSSTLGRFRNSLRQFLKGDPAASGTAREYRNRLIGLLEAMLYQQPMQNSQRKAESPSSPH